MTTMWSCTSDVDETFDQNPISSVSKNTEVYGVNGGNATAFANFTDVAKMNGSVLITESPIRITNTDADTDADATIASTRQRAALNTSEIKVSQQFFINYFPCGTDNISKYFDRETGVYTAPEELEKFSIDFMYVSEGVPYTIYPIFSAGRYNLTLGLFYYDNDMVYHEVDIWNMAESGWKDNDNVSRNVYAKNATGYELNIPAGYVFGFYVYGKDTYSGDAPNNLFSNRFSSKFYCARFFNEDAESDCFKSYYTGCGTTKDDKGIHAATFTVDGNTFIGFEDQENGDMDLNDLICYITPDIPVLTEPSLETISQTVGAKESNGEVEVDIHHQSHQDWNEIKTSIHVRDTVDVKVTIPLEQDYAIEQDDFAVRVYTEYYKVGDTEYPVNVTVAHNADNITYTVSGVTAEMLKALRSKYDDGITIEIHSYFKSLTDDQLWSRIKDSKVETFGYKTTVKGQITQHDSDNRVNL